MNNLLRRYRILVANKMNTLLVFIIGLLVLGFILVLAAITISSLWIYSAL